ncbi:MAG: metallophosphoesterase [Bacillota bacterium]|nr:metallophosphoesterase [Bacillota bacterium]
MENYKRKKRIVCWSIAAAVFALLFAYSFAEPFLVQVDRESFYGKDLPASFSGVKIGFLADTHFGPYTSREQLRSIVELMNAESPDIVILGGDYVKRNPADVPVCFEELARIKAPLGKYAIMGNHDYWVPSDDIITQMKKAGFTPLVNKNVQVWHLGQRIFIAGLDDYDEGMPNLDEALSGITMGDFAILVLHSPFYLKDKGNEYAQEFKLVDFALAAHTHGGQATFFGLWSPGEPDQFLPMYASRWRERGGVISLVSNGTGTSVLPLRFFALPEINIIELEKPAAADAVQ